MKILQINTLDNKGGAAKVCTRLKKFLDKENIANWLIVKNKKEKTNLEFEKSFVQKLFNKILKMEGFGKNNLSELRKYSFWEEIDIINFHNLHGGYFNIFNLPKISKIKKCIWTLHDPWILNKKKILVPEYKNIFKRENKIFNIFKKRAINNSKIILITPSEWLKSKVLKEYPDKEILVIPNGININVFCPTDKQTARKILNLPDNKKIVLFVANGGIKNNEKGSSFLEKMKNKYKNIIFIELGGKNYITDEKELALYYSAGNILLFPSLAENLPLTILESMSCNTPVVAFDTGGISEIIDHKINGYIAKYKDLDDLSLGIEFVLNNQLKLTNSPREKIVKEFNEENTLKKYLEIYQRLS